jgi:diguanylate cyclase (GGDEF)-like protein
MVAVSGGRDEPVDRSVINADTLSAALLEIEDRISWEPDVYFERSRELESRAMAIGDELLAARARLCQANMRLRAGDVASAARRIWKIHQWAVEHDAQQLTARTHLVWATIHRYLGDAALCLEHSLLAVELLDGTATEHMRIWHHVKLADALALAGSYDAARLRYEQAEELAVAAGDPELLLGVLNNFAYNQLAAGNPVAAQEIADRMRRQVAAIGRELDPDKLDTIGMIEIGNERYAEAEQTMQLGIDRHRNGKYDEDADSLAEFQLTLARAQRGLGAYDRAQQSLDLSRELCLARELADTTVRVQQEQAELHAARGEFAEAFAAHKTFFSAHNKLHSQQREAQARTRQAMFETTEARQEAERFREQARRDPLTGLHNRRYVDEVLPALMDADPGLSVAIVDLDHFKQINDRLSHDVGDQVLIRAAKLMESELAAISPDGFIARMGGEEFLIVLPATPVGRAVALLDGLRRAVRGYAWEATTRGLPVTVSIGVAQLAECGAADLLSTADRNLYAAKHRGRDRVVCGAPSDGWVRSYRDASAA